MNETNVYKELYDTQKQVEMLKTTVMAVAERLIIATGINPQEATMDKLLDLVDEKFGVEAKQESEEVSE
ncbi:hypothetical protein CPT_Michonne85 [Citrobacter phage Michonne]|uniref:Tail fiber assembly protein n=2 Tax=Mooglevirus mordin TaxID=1985305 RepID=A0A0K2CMS4_9CAUD|nr:hypothetical protein CPT_Michonne_gp085 [Citrobacter phage Michonne]YP_009606586.1 hypothetical protein FDI02_gp136 [Citrobacter phage Mordin]AKU44034.1 hypothetical protein CPT_Michonne85 [Citrobacter phage Michonne]ALA06900.1 hypothetical protein Mordin_84 [Citrobacter phage Mordin]AYR00828.1 hypothetical protein CPT_Maleficent_084 [Citrobacter phage Maleficent]